MFPQCFRVSPVSPFFKSFIKNQKNLYICKTFEKGETGETLQKGETSKNTFFTHHNYI